MEKRAAPTWVQGARSGGKALVLRVPEGFQPSAHVPDDVMGIIRELSELRPGAVETEYLPPAAGTGEPRELRELRPEKLQAAILAMCERYGPLGSLETFRDEKGHVFRGEPFTRWSDESRLIQRAVYLLRLVGLLKARRKLEWWEVLHADAAYELTLFEEQIEPALEWVKQQSFENDDLAINAWRIRNVACDRGRSRPRVRVERVHCASW